MANIYKVFRNDKLENTGIILNYGDFSIKIKRAGGLNKDYLKSLAKHGKENKLAMKNDTIDDEKSRIIFARIYAESIVIGWENVEDKNGEIAFNYDNCLKLLIELPDLFDDIQKCASDVSLFRAEEEYLEESKKQ